MFRGRPVTHATRIMVPTYIGTDLLFGFYFISDQGGDLSRSPSLTYVHQQLPITVWGFLFVGLALLVLLGTLWPPIRRGTELGLAINAVAWFSWAVLVEKAYYLPNVSTIAGALPLFVAIASFASTVSLVRNETDHAG